jgi:hypothetical protein
LRETVPRDTLRAPRFIWLGSERKEVSVAEMAKYRGGCHCGRVRYEVETALDPVMSCNCSICQKRGALLTFVPAAQFTLLSGASDLTDYLFNSTTCSAAIAASAPSPGERDPTERR